MIHTGDCIEVMRTMPADLVDAIVTDPPYMLSFMGKTWDRPTMSGHSQPDPASPGFYGKGGTHDRGFATWEPARMGEWHRRWATEALRVTKPGGYLLAFGGTRTHHRLVCGLEDAGWIIRDELDWIYASGFPKGKANLKPAHEPIVLARKPGPLRPLNIEECRIGTTREVPASHSTTAPTIGATGFADRRIPSELDPNMGRWPSNLLLSDPELFDEPNPWIVGSGATVSSGLMKAGTIEGGVSVARNDMPGREMVRDTYADSGGYSRFFLVPKASRDDREPIIGRDAKTRLNKHPTVKPVPLMRHLVRLVTPPGGTVLDCFAGSGSTLLACELEGFAWIGVEQDPESVAIAEARLNGTQRGLGLDVGAPTRKAPNTPGRFPERQTPTKSASFGAWRGFDKPEEEPAA